MNCEYYCKQLSAQVDGELDHPLARDLEEHLAACPECRAFREHVVMLGRELQAIAAAKPAIGVAERVKERVARERERRFDRGLLPAWTRVPLVAMIALVAVGLGNAAGRSISAMIASERSTDSVEYLLADQGPSFADVLMENGNEENGR